MARRGHASTEAKDLPHEGRGDRQRDELRNAAGKPAPRFPCDVSFSAYAAAWLRATKTAVREGTARSYEGVIRNHFNDTFPGKLRDITPTFSETKSGYVHACTPGRATPPSRPCPARRVSAASRADQYGRICVTDDGTVPTMPNCTTLK